MLNDESWEDARDVFWEFPSLLSKPFLSALQNMGVEFLHGVENFHQGEILFVKVV